jgi:hypothetical protein
MHSWVSPRPGHAEYDLSVLDFLLSTAEAVLWMLPVLSQEEEEVVSVR